MHVLFPDPDEVAAEIIRQGLGDDVAVETQLDDEFIKDDRFPYVLVEATGGSLMDPTRASRPAISITSYTKGQKVDCSRLAEACRTALVKAWLSQTVYSGASISAIRAQMMPFPQPQEGQPVNVFRYVGRYDFILRPE